MEVVQARCHDAVTSVVTGMAVLTDRYVTAIVPLHQERLEREYDLDLIVTAPSVVYRVTMNDGTEVSVDSPAKLADADKRQSVSEPYVALEMFCPKEYSGTLMELMQERRGEYKDMKFLTERRVSIKYDLPLAEVITLIS